MEAIALLAGLALAINKTVSVIKAATAKVWSDVKTQVLVWIVGVGAMFLAAASDLTEGLEVPGITPTLGDLNAASLVLLAWVLGSSGSFAFDLKKAIDNKDSAAEPNGLR